MFLLIQFSSAKSNELTPRFLQSGRSTTLLERPSIANRR